MPRKTYKERIEELRMFIAQQSDPGTGDDSPYMLGMANGMIFALSVITGEDPQYLNPPEFFRADYEMLDQLNKSGIILKHDTDT